MRGVLSGVLQALTSLLCLILVGSVRTTFDSQNGCYNTDVMLSCPHYTQNKPGRLVWSSKNKTASTWTEIGSMRNGNQSLISANLDNRIAIHSNGSLQISSLQPDDETLYKCKAYVEGAPPGVHVTDLKVACSKVTRIKQEVCADSDIVLECDAKHRTNPRKLNQVKWHKKNISGKDVSWSLLVASDGSNVTVGDGFKLHGNGSLLVQGGRDQSEVIFKCVATMNLLSSRHTHVVMVKNVKCRREKRQTSVTLGTTVKTTAGRVAMTTPIVVSMETTTTPTLPSRASNSLVHWNQTWLLYAIIGLALIGIVRCD